MPFYEYECSSCKFYSEVMQKITDAPLTKCPSCGRKTLKKLVSAPNFRLKGGGWYETDFKGDQENKRNLAGADKDDSAPKAEGSAAASKPDSAKAETSGEPKTDASKGKPPSEAKPEAAAKSSGTKGSASKSRPSVAGGRSARSSSGKSRAAAGRARPKPAARKKARR